MSCLKSCCFIHIEFPWSKTKWYPSYCYNIASTLPHWYININQLIYSLNIHRSVNCSVSNGGFICIWTDLVLTWVPGKSGKMHSTSAHVLLELTFFLLTCQFWNFREPTADMIVPASPQQCWNDIPGDWTA